MDGTIGWRRLRFLMAVLAASFFPHGVCAGGPPDQAATLRREMQEDAELTDVAFVDAMHGWAVGDRGMIWATADGGRHWRAQMSGVNCRLNSVQFLNAENGWAAGGWYHPYTHTCRGVLLRTRDGGKTWAQDKGLMLPALSRLKFVGPNVAWACGERSALFPGAVFLTENGCRTWEPVLGMEGRGWLAADFIDPHTGAVAGRNGSLAFIHDRGLQPTRAPRLELRGANRMRFSSGTEAWLVGDGGLVLTTTDQGVTWQLPATALPTGAEFDWHALEVRGSRIWLAGSPGSKVLTSRDGGRTWETSDTGQTLPLSALAFADNLHGWAVGALGSILATSDGGRTWQRQHAGGARAAWLALYDRAENVPLELLARLSANEGYLGAVRLLTRTDQDTAGDGPSRLERSRAALVAAGASSAETAWAFPAPPADSTTSAEQIVDSWNRLNDGEGIDRVQACIVRQIRCWRPEIVLTHAASLKGENAAGHLMNQLVLAAVEQAADATCFPEQLEPMGLQPWRVRKVFGTLPDGQLGDINLATSQLAQRLGESLADFTIGPRGLIADGYSAAAANIGFRLHVDTLPQRVGEQDFFSGIALHPGGDARRMINEFSTQGIDLMRRMSQKQRNMEAIITRCERGQLDAARYVAEIKDLVSGLDASRAGNVVYQLAERYRQSGKWDLAADTFSLLAQQYPEHPLSEAAMVWLLKYWSSGEAAWWQRQLAAANGRQALDAQVANQAAVYQPSATLAQVLPGKNQVARADGATIQGRMAVVDHTLASDWAGRAASLGRLLEQRSPATFAEPSIHFVLAAAERKAGMAKQAERYYQEAARFRARDAWWACAAGEQWLKEPNDHSPKPLLHAARGTKPKLDGEFDDDIWQNAKQVELKGTLRDEAPSPASVRLAYDGEYLYVAAECRQASGINYPESDSPRPRDPDLSGQDRIDFYLDLDRDWATWYRLSIDHRGWTGEACWEDQRWNPQWFVAAKTNDGTWTAEAAIPLSELAPQSPSARDVWAIGIERTIPGLGKQSWTAPAGSREAGGYLVFD